MPQITIPLSKYLYKTMATLYDDWLDDHGLYLMLCSYLKSYSSKDIKDSGL
jgi:hypothetical protein